MSISGKLAENIPICQISACNAELKAAQLNHLSCVWIRHRLDWIIYCITLCIVVLKGDNAASGDRPPANPSAATTPTHPRQWQAIACLVIRSTFTPSKYLNIRLSYSMMSQNLVNFHIKSRPYLTVLSEKQVHCSACTKTISIRRSSVKFCISSHENSNAHLVNIKRWQNSRLRQLTIAEQPPDNFSLRLAEVLTACNIVKE